MINTSIHTGAKLSILRQPANAALLLVLALALVLGSCSQKPDPEKKNPVSRKEIVGVLVEIHLLEARSDRLLIPRDSILSQYKIAYNDILARHHVTEANFRKTMDFYLKNPDKMDLMYQDVVDELSRVEAQQAGTPANTDPIPKKPE